MAILPMQRMTVCALRTRRKQVLELLQRFGTAEPCPLGAQEGDAVFARTATEAQRAAFEKSGAQAAQAIRVLLEYVDEKASPLDSLRGRTALSAAEYEAALAKNEATAAAISEILEQSRDMAERKAENVRLAGQMTALEPWLALPVPTGFAGTKTTSALIGTLPGGAKREQILALLAEKLPETEAFELDVLDERPDATYIFLLCRIPDAEPIEAVLRSAGFVRVASATKLPPKEETQQLAARIEANKAAREADKAAIAAFGGQLQDLRFYQDYCAMRKEKYEVLGGLAQSKHTFFLTAWVAERDVPALQAALEALGAAVSVRSPEPEEESPIALANNGFAAPVESVVESYSMPTKGEFDPTFVMSLFYYLLFGLMLSDAGYGLLMVLGCGICLAKFKTMEPGMKNTLKMFFFCGISTTVWGFVFGSFFGDSVAVIATTFFGSDLRLPPLWFEPLADPMKMLIFSLGLGIVHLFTGLAVNIAQHFKNKEYRDALYDGVFWYLLVGGLTILLMTSTMFDDLAQFHLTLSSLGMTVLKGAILTGAIGILLTSGRESKNWFKRLLKGMYGLYNVTGYLSDILSYSRLLALGLATGVIASIINKMGGMAAGSGGIVGAVIFTAIFVFGHLINMAINLLGAYVHTNRLQFVEYFGKFYSGGGRKFSPFAVHTKYYKLSKEETNHG